MTFFSLLASLFIYGIPILLAVSLHEVAHGWIALKCGDPTAKMLGRLTLNPIKHIDPVGTILVPFILFSLSGFLFGWAKPVPVVWNNLRSPRRDMALVAAAGPLANFMMALLWGIVLKLLIIMDPNQAPSLLSSMAKVGILINLVLMTLNLLPIPPLDGSRILFSIASPRMTHRFAEFELYGFLILVLLLATGVLTAILKPVMEYLFYLITLLLGL